MNTTKFTLELDNDLIKKIDDIASTNDRSRVAQIRTMLKNSVV